MSFNAALNRVEITGITSDIDFNRFNRYEVQCATFYRNKHYVVLSEQFNDNLFLYKLTVSLLDEATEYFQNIVDIGIFTLTDFGQAACGSGRYQTDINGLQQMRIIHHQRLFFCLRFFGAFRPCRTLDPVNPQFVIPLDSTVPIFGVTGTDELITLTFKDRFNCLMRTGSFSGTQLAIVEFNEKFNINGRKKSGFWTSRSVTIGKSTERLLAAVPDSYGISLFFAEDSFNPLTVNGKKLKEVTVARISNNIWTELGKLKIP